MTNDGIITAAELFGLHDSVMAILHKMPDSITDGQQFDEWEEGVPGIDDLDDDARYEDYRQREIDDAAEQLNETLRDIARTRV